MAPAGAGRTPGAQAAPSPRLDIVEQWRRLCCNAVAIDNEGRLLATVSNNVLTLWDLESGLELRTLVARARAIARKPDEAVDSVSASSYTGLAFDPSGRYVALTAVDNLNPRTSDRGRHLAFPHVWEVETGRDLSAVDWTHDAATQRTVSAAFPFDPRAVLFWQATTDPSVVAKLARYAGPATTFSPDGGLGIGFVLEGGPDYAYRLTSFDLESNRALWTIRNEESAPPVATFSPDGHWVALGSWKGTRILDARTGTQAATVAGSNGAGVPVAFSRDSRRLIVARANQAQIFSAPDWRSGSEMRFPDEEFIQAVTFTPNGDRALAIGGDAIHVVDAVGARELRRISMDGARPLQTMAVSPRGRWLAVSTSKTPPALSDRTEEATVFAWPLSGDGVPRSLSTAAFGSIPALAFSPDEARLGNVSLVEHLSRGGPMFDGDIEWVDLANATRQSLTFETDEVRQGRYDVIPRAAAKELAFTNDGSTIVAGMLGLRAFHSDSNHEFEPFPQLVFYDAATMKPRRTVDLGGADFTALATNADGSLLATGHDLNTVRLWTTATARQRSFYLWPAVDRRDALGYFQYGGSITGLAFHPYGRRLAVARHDGAAVVDVMRGTRQEIAAASDQGYSAVAFSPDGASLLYASGTLQNRGFIEARVSQWVTATGKQGWTVELGTTDVPRLAFAPNGKWFAAATSGGVSIHDASTGLRLVSLAVLGTDDWFVWTPDGRYAGSPAGIARLGAVRQGRRVVPIAAVGRKLELPDLLAQVLP